MVRRPCTLPASARASNRVSATTQSRPPALVAGASEPGGRGPRPARRGVRRRRRTRRRPGARRGPTRWRAPPSSSARRGGGVEVAFAEHGARSTFDRFVHGLPSGAPAQVRGERTVEVDAARLAPGLRGRDPHEDPGRAEPALRTAARHEPGREVVAHRAVEPVDGRHRPAGDARRGRDAGDAWFAVDQDRAAPALALGRAPVLHREHAQVARAAPRATTPPGRRRPRPAHRRTRTAPDAQIRSRPGRIGGWLSTPPSSARSPAGDSSVAVSRRPGGSR